MTAATLNMVVRPVTNLMNVWSTRFAMWRDEQLGYFFAWTLSKRPVQAAVANAFSGSTPMCRVLRDAIVQGIEDHGLEIDVDNVSGLERYIENSISNLDAGDLKNIDEVVVNAIDHEEIEKVIVETIIERLRG